MAAAIAEYVAKEIRFVIKVSFADKRPQGAYALAVPVRSEDMLHERLAGLDEGARTLAARSAEAQRFEREVGAIAETFVEEGDGVRRLLLVGYGARQDEVAIHERVGGALTAKLLTSGETRLVIDASGIDARSAARLAFGAAARSWRHDVYRTRLGRKQKPTLEEVVIVGAAKGADAEWAHEAAVLAGLDLTRGLVTDPPNIIYPETFVARCREALEGLGVQIEVLDAKAMAKLGMGALLGVAQGSHRPPQLLAMRWNGAGKNADTVAFVGKGITF
ncbi:MAG: M17 family peptidase N-terminal domain-containing protein, partial [Allosphingosinicella sp.]